MGCRSIRDGLQLNNWDKGGGVAHELRGVLKVECSSKGKGCSSLFIFLIHTIWISYNKF